MVLNEDFWCLDQVYYKKYGVSDKIQYSCYFSVSDTIGNQLDHWDWTQ